MNSRKARFVLFPTAVVLTASLMTGCGVDEGEKEGAQAAASSRAEAVERIAPVLVLGSSDPAELALTASQAFFEAAPVVVLAAADDESAHPAAAAAALELNAPVLLTGGAIADSGLAKEVERLGALAAVVVTPDQDPTKEIAGGASSGTVVVPVGAADGVDEAAKRSAEDVDPALDVVLLDAGSLVVAPDGAQSIDERDLADLTDALPSTQSPRLLTEVLALVDGTAGQTAAVATAQAAGVVPLMLPGGDPRATSESVQALSKAKALAVVGIGPSFGTTEELTVRVRAAETGVELAGGGQLVSAGKRYVVLPSTEVPSTTAKIADVVEAAATLAEPYAEVAAAAGDPTATVPTVELVVTRSSATAGKDGDYSTELTAEAVRPVAQAALDAGQHVLLEFQPGSASFVDQVKRFADVLALPGVGVSLDLDARRAGGLVKQDGVVPAEEVNAVVAYLAGLVESKALPQKMVVVHASTPRSVASWGALTADDDRVAVVAHSDVSGSFAARSTAWGALTAGAPTSLSWGWTALAGEVNPERAATTDPLAPAPMLVVVE